MATLADTIEITTQKINSTYLKTLLDNLRGKLVHAVLGCITDDMVNGSTTISWSTVLANVLNAPIAKLAMGDNVNASKDLLNAGALEISQL